MGVFDDIRRDREAGTSPECGYWIWSGQPSNITLSTMSCGRRHVMGFARKGLNGAQPTFQINRCGMIKAGDELVEFSVGDGTARGDAQAKKDETVYRYDICGIDHPDARRIARTPLIEEIVLAAEHLANAARRFKDFADDHASHDEVMPKGTTLEGKMLDRALAAFRRAAGGE